jgi:hypothetical protein
MQSSHSTSRFPSLTTSRCLFSRDPHSRFYYDANSDPGGGQSNPPAVPPAPPQKTVAEQVQDAISELLGKKNNDPMKVMETLIKQNHALEQRARDAEAKVGQIPATVQAELDSYRALGKPDELKTRVEAGEAAITERDTLKRSSERAKAVKAAGYDPDKYSALAFADEYDYETKTETVNGKPVEVAYGRRTVDGKEEVKKVAEIIAERAGALGDALKAGGAQNNGGVRPPVMGVNTGSVKTSYDRIREEAKAKREGRAPGNTLAERMGLKKD